MPLRSFFIVVLKILGLLFIEDFLAAIPSLLTSFGYMLQAEGAGKAFGILYAMILVLSIYGIIPYLLLFRPTWLVDKLGLERGFPQDVLPLNIHRSTMLSIAIMLVGGLMVANEIPVLCRLLLTYSQERRSGQMNPELSYLLQSAAKIVVGILLVSNQNQLVSFLEHKRKR